MYSGRNYVSYLEDPCLFGKNYKIKERNKMTEEFNTVEKFRFKTIQLSKSQRDPRAAAANDHHVIALRLTIQ